MTWMFHLHVRITVNLNTKQDNAGSVPKLFRSIFVVVKTQNVINTDGLHKRLLAHILHDTLISFPLYLVILTSTIDFSLDVSSAEAMLYG